MKKILSHLRTYVLRGIVAMIPIGLTYFVIRFLYVAIDKRVAQLIEKSIGFSIPGLGIILVIICLYFIGVVASNVVGQQMFKLVERITDRIPIVKSTYQIGKQLSVTLSLPEKQVFKRAVLVDYLKPEIWTNGFVTGTLTDRKNNNETLLKVFVPTPPNPTSGTMVVVKEGETRDPGWSIEEAIRAVISDGIIGPTEIK